MYITLADKKLNWDVVPTTLIKNYPFTDSSYKPLCEIKGYIYSGDLHLWVVAFEWDFLDSPTAADQSLINIHIGSGPSCIISCPHEGDVMLEKSDEKLTIYFSCTPISGGDNQGDYWGYELTIPKKTLKTLGIKKTNVGSYINMNVTKTQLDKRNFHYGILNLGSGEPSINSVEAIPQLIIKY